MTSIEDTLILVTADHAHTLTISGYLVRGNPIMGIAEISENTGPQTGDGLPYGTLSYANGPGYHTHPHGADNFRYNISKDNMDGKDYMEDATVPLESESHGGDDVIVYSRGPFNHLLRGVVQQCYIPHVRGYASGTSPWSNYKDTKKSGDGGAAGVKSSILVMSMAVIFVGVYTL